MTFDLCEWNKTLAPSLAESANDVRVARFLRDSFPYPYTERDAERFIEAALKDSAGLSRAIIVQGRAVGAIALTKMSDVYQKKCGTRLLACSCFLEARDHDRGRALNMPKGI